MKKLILFSTSILILISCSSNKEDENSLIKKKLTSFINDEYFKRNLSIEIFDITIVEIKPAPMDTIIRNSLSNEYFRRILELKKATPNWENDPDFFNKSDLYARKSPKGIEFKKLQEDIKPNQTGKYVIARIKGTIIDRANRSSNFISKIFFALDDKNDVIDSGLFYNQTE